MSQYKKQGAGQLKRSTNLFYRSGINSLLSRLEKLENEVFCCKDHDKVYALSSNQTLDRKIHNHETILWDCGTDDDTLTVWYPTKGDSLTIILNTDANASGGGIHVTGGGQFWGTVTVGKENATADEAGFVSVASDETAADYDVILLDANGTVTGGQDGNRIHLFCTSDGKWHTDTLLTTTGTPASCAPIAGAVA
jgi:hypothetical protein